MSDGDLVRLLSDDPAHGRAVVFDLLARGPRIKPSRGLLIDPGDEVWQRWERRVAAAVALLAGPAVAPVVDELLDELRESPELAADVLARTVPWPGLPAAQQDALRRLSG